MTKKRVKFVLTCPECESQEVAVMEETMWMVNTMEHYCNSVKNYDSDATATCLHCRWVGLRQDLKEIQQ